MRSLRPLPNAPAYQHDQPSTPSHRHSKNKRRSSAKNRRCVRPLLPPPRPSLEAFPRCEKNCGPRQAYIRKRPATQARSVPRARTVNWSQAASRAGLGGRHLGSSSDDPVPRQVRHTLRPEFLVALRPVRRFRQSPERRNRHPPTRIVARTGCLRPGTGMAGTFLSKKQMLMLD